MHSFQLQMLKIVTEIQNMDIAYLIWNMIRARYMICQDISQKHLLC